MRCRRCRKRICASRRPALRETIRWLVEHGRCRFDRWPPAAQLCKSRDKSYEEKFQRLVQIAFQFRSLHDGIQEAMLQEKFTGLKTIRKLLADGLLNHARAREADQRARFGDVQVAKHGETSRNTAGSG